jgi:hypothetical protein
MEPKLVPLREDEASELAHNLRGIIRAYADILAPLTQAQQRMHKLPDASNLATDADALVAYVTDRRKELQDLHDSVTRGLRKLNSVWAEGNRVQDKRSGEYGTIAMLIKARRPDAADLAEVVWDGNRATDRVLVTDLDRVLT